MYNDNGFYDDFDKTRPIKLPSKRERQPQRGKPMQNSPKRRKNKKKGGKAKKIILTICITLVVLVIAGLGFGMYFLNGFDSGDIPKAAEPVTGNVNFLVIGKDAGDLNDPTAEEVKRTDTILLVNMNLDTKDLTAISIPRDTLVINDQGYEAKINSLYQQGVEVLQQEVEELLLVDVNYIVEINFSAFEEFIDAIGGIEVTPEYDMYYEDKTAGFTINHQKGVATQLDGKDALLYFRWRQNADGTGGELGDIGRINHQQKFLKEIFKKCTEPGIVTKIPEIIKVVQKNITTNMSGTAIAKYAKEAVGIDFSSLEMATLEGEFYQEEDEYGNLLFSFWRVDLAKNYELISKINPDLDLMDLRKESLRIVVLNGTGIPGLAAEMQADLLAKGYTNVEPGNTFGTIETSSIECLEDDIATAICEDTGINNKLLQLTEGYDYDVIVTIGLDHPLVNGTSSASETE